VRQRTINLLIVDDQSGIRGLLYEVFRSEGYRLFLASGGREAVTLAQQNPPDIVLLDIRMPDMDGVETLRILKKINPEARICVMTALDLSGRVRRALERGVDRFISKPFDIDEIRKVVRLLAVKKGAPGTQSSQVAEERRAYGEPENGRGSSS